MNGDSKAKIEQIAEAGYDFKFGDYISRGFDIVQKNWGGYIGFTILFLLITMVVNFIPIIGMIANGFIISPALTVGFFIVAHKIWKGEISEFGDFFKGFDHIGQLALTALVQSLIIYGSLIPFGIAIWDSGLIEWYTSAIQDPVEMRGSLPNFPPSWSLLLLLPAIYFGVSYSWSYMFVVFHKMQFWDAMESSRKMVGKNWFIIFLFYIVIGIIAVAGVIGLCIGVLFTIPAVYCMMYAAFEDVTQLNAAPDEDDNIEQHLIV